MISIIVPVYNGENYIEKCVTSILNQSYQDWELILVDNGSQDKSPVLCEKLACQDERIQVFHEEVNSGVSAARNRGMTKAKGEYLTFIDADDWIMPDFLERLFVLQGEKQADMVVCGYEKCFAGNREQQSTRERTETESKDKRRTEKRAEDKQKAGEQAESGSVDKRRSGERRESKAVEYTRLSYLESYLLEGNTHCWGVLYSRKLIADIRFPLGLSIGEDLLFLIDAAMKAEKIAVTDYSGYQYLINAAGAMEKPFTPSYMDQILCWQQADERLGKFYPQLRTRLKSILLVSTLLVVGKLARLPENERKKYKKEEEYCRQLVKEYSREKGVFSYLPTGYPLKVSFYRYFPRLYLLAYGRWKA